MPLTSVILKNPVPIRVQGGPMQQDGGKNGAAGGWVLKGGCNIVLIRARDSLSKRKKYGN